MKKVTLVFTLCMLLMTINVFSKATWPREITTENGAVITIYQPQPESLTGNKLVARMVVSVKGNKTKEPVFGVVWTETTLLTDKVDRVATMEEFKVTGSKFPDVTDQSKYDELKKILETEIPKWKLDINIDEIVATIEQDQPQGTDQLGTNPPDVIFRNEPTTLILIDGEPKEHMDDQLNMERIINTPFFIVNNPDDKKYYLFAGSVWYVSASVKEGWSVAKSLTPKMKALDSEIRKKENENKQQDDSGNPASSSPAATLSPTSIIVRTSPAELIQTTGEPNFASVEGTGLLYVSNTNDEIFKYVEDQQYYILLTGRWYKAANLNGPWNYVASDKLPADFAKIPEGSEKDVVLPFVAGTDAAREAVMDAQIPQTAKVDRNSTECTVKYDGEPKFEPIQGTNLEVAVNTSSTVLLTDNKYYAVDNGVWFVSANPSGPWKVSEERPADVDKIPPENQVYNVKYVYIYETTPEYVYVGYTPGYTGCYVYGPTVVYGTGYYYNPWYGPWYYPRPVTYGFGMTYNPWTGWGMSFGYSVGFFSVSIGFGGYGHYGGYWGCAGYHPPYHSGYGGHYGNSYTHNDINFDNERNHNIYNNRGDATTKDLNHRPSSSGRGGNTASTRPATGTGSSGRLSTGAGASTRDVSSPRPSNKTSNNMYSDKSGNVYRQDSKGGVQQRSNNSWQSSSRSNNKAGTYDVNRSSQQRDRGNMRTTQSTQSRYSSRGYSKPSTGGYSGGGGGRR